MLQYNHPPVAPMKGYNYELFGLVWMDPCHQLVDTAPMSAIMIEHRSVRLSSVAEMVSLVLC